uniref:Uncharacterized protein n=1 Tax=Arundo donax TaxID=35708 RepID=A0A0A9CR12_ARUDO
MKELGCFNLEIEFEDVVKFNIELAIDIVNDNRCNLKLLPVACKFLIDEGFDAEGLIWKLKLIFRQKPRCITRVKQFFGKGLVIKFDDIFGQGYKGSTLSEITCALLGGYAAYIFHMHRLGWSWKGEYSLDDMYVIDNSLFVIGKKPEVLVGDEQAQFLAKKKDLTGLVQHFTPHLESRELEEQQGQPPMDSSLPLFFSELCDALRNMKMEELGQPWFEECILNFPALKLPQARNDFICAVHLALQNPFLDASIREVVGVRPSKGDWRKDIERKNISFGHGV